MRRGGAVLIAGAAPLEEEHPVGSTEFTTAGAVRVMLAEESSRGFRDVQQLPKRRIGGSESTAVNGAAASRSAWRADLLHGLIVFAAIVASGLAGFVLPLLGARFFLPLLPSGIAVA